MTLFKEDLHVLNVGLASFADAIVDAGGNAIRIEWTPPAGGDAAVGRALARLVNHKDVEAANSKAYAAYLSSQPILEGIELAKTAIPDMGAAHDTSRRAAHLLGSDVRADAGRHSGCDRIGGVGSK